MSNCQWVKGEGLTDYVSIKTPFIFPLKIFNSRKQKNIVDLFCNDRTRHRFTIFANENLDAAIQQHDMLHLITRTESDFEHGMKIAELGHRQINLTSYQIADFHTIDLHCYRSDDEGEFLCDLLYDGKNNNPALVWREPTRKNWYGRIGVYDLTNRSYTNLEITGRHLQVKESHGRNFFSCQVPASIAHEKLLDTDFNVLTRMNSESDFESTLFRSDLQTVDNTGASEAESYGSPELHPRYEIHFDTKGAVYSASRIDPNKLS